MSIQQIILHLDMNSYFASVEQQANPHLRGRPVGVCEHLGGIIIAPSVEAKRLGIKLGTPVWEAVKICPKIVLLPVDPDKYREITRRFIRILFDYTDRVEKASIDEAFVELTGICADYDEALLLALEIKQRLRREAGEWISASVGLGPNKLLAKIAADLSPCGRSPAGRGEADIDRIFIIRPEDIPRLYERLKLTDIPGIAHRLERTVNKLGILNLRQLAEYPLANLLSQFGIIGWQLHQLANFDHSPLLQFLPTGGEERRGEKEKKEGGGELRSEQEIKSMGHSYTLPKPIQDLRDIKRLMLKLSEKIGRRLRRQGLKGTRLHYFHSDKRYHVFQKQRKILELINDGRLIYHQAYKIFAQSLPLRFPIKIMGVTVAGLEEDLALEPLLPEFKKPELVIKAMDKINDKYGEFTLRRARLLQIHEDWAKDTVGFGRMKELSL